MVSCLGTELAPLTRHGALADASLAGADDYDFSDVRDGSFVGYPLGSPRHHWRNLIGRESLRNANMSERDADWPPRSVLTNGFSWDLRKLDELKDRTMAYLTLPVPLLTANVSPLESILMELKKRVKGWEEVGEVECRTDASSPLFVLSSLPQPSAMPLLQPYTSVTASSLLTLSYVGGLYLSSATRVGTINAQGLRRTKNDADVVAARLKAVSATTAAGALATVALLWAHDGSERVGRHASTARKALVC